MLADLDIEQHLEWEQLSPYKQIRRRTEMYFGSRDPHTQIVVDYDDNGLLLREETWVPAVFTALREIVDNAVDELISHKRGKRLDITYDADALIMSVTDDGGGMPIEWSDEHQNYAATILLSSMFSGRNFSDDRGDTRGLNGVGSKGVVFCSEWFKIEVFRDKKHFIQTFTEGEELQIDPPTIWPTNGRKRGTKILYKLSSHVFKDRRLPENFVAARMYEIALCYPQIELTFNGKKLVTGNLFGARQPITVHIEDTDFRAKFWLLPHDDSDEFTFSLINALPLFGGGTHIDAFRRSFYNGLLAALDRESKRRKLALNRSDISDGLLIYCIGECANPHFDTAKTRLINEQVGLLVRKKLDDSALFKQIIHDNKPWIDTIYERCAVRTQSKNLKDTVRQAKRNLRQKVEDLEDACGHDRSKCILFLTEGKSACSSISEARDPNIFGALPLRGKIPNTHDLSHQKILSNEALSNIMNAIGLIPGQRVNRHTLRYGKVYLACDADPDGSNIAALLVNFFYTWPELFDPTKPPFVYVFNTPLIIAKKGKKQQHWHADDYTNFDATKYKGWDIIRAKGLAALTREDWTYCLNKPKIEPIFDDGNLQSTLNLLFDQTRADDRKVWMSI